MTDRTDCDPPLRYGGYIAGVRHYDAADILHQPHRGMILHMVRVRHNPYDSNAIRLMIGRYMICYVPKGPNVEIARRLDRAEAMLCRIEFVRTDEKPWQPIEIRVESQSLARPWWTESEIGDRDDDVIYSKDRFGTFDDAGFTDV